MKISKNLFIIIRMIPVYGGMDSVAFICFAPPGVPGGVSLC